MRLIWRDLDGYSQPIHYGKPLCGIVRNGKRPTHVEFTSADLKAMLLEKHAEKKYEWLNVLWASLRKTDEEMNE